MMFSNSGSAYFSDQGSWVSARLEDFVDNALATPQQNPKNFKNF